MNLRLLNLLRLFPSLSLAALRAALASSCLLYSVSCLLPQPLAAAPFADTIRPYVKNGTTSGAVFLVANNEKILACEAAGFADIDDKTPMQTDSFFWIASMTKPMTAACIMMLVDEGKISLDDPVAKYIPEFAAPQKITPKKGATTLTPDGRTVATASQKNSSKSSVRQVPITLRHLLSHTAGMQRSDPDAGPYVDALPLAKAVPIFARLDLFFEPGTDYSYSNIDISTLGRVIEIVSGIPYETFLQQRLFDPLGMTDTTFWPTKPQLKRLATSYRGNPKKGTLTEEKLTNYRYPLDNRAKRHPAPGGGLFSSANDVVRFGQLLLNKGTFNGKRLLSESSVAEMSRRQTPPGKADYGLCLELGKTGQFGHNGAQGTNFTVWPEKNLVTVFMVQRISKWGGPDGANLRPALETIATQNHSP